jgi:DNA repair exonuclease SbcCD ATPase subunit
MDHMKLTDELRQQLMEAAVWKNDEISSRLDESSAVEELEEKTSCGSKKGKKAMKKGYMEDTEYDEEEGEELEEAAHVCPLCVSQLDESIDEERILEHLNVVLGLVDRLSQLNEGDEDIESVIDETIAELLFADEEE